MPGTEFRSVGLLDLDVAVLDELAPALDVRLDQIGKLFGLSRERVRQIEREVMIKLRNGDRAERLRSYAS